MVESLSADISSLDALVAKSHVERYGAISFVGGVHLSGLTRSQQAQLGAHIEFNRAEAPLDVHALNAALRRQERQQTPPPDDKDVRAIEAEAREKLVADKCPPCYPAGVGYPSQEPAEEYRAIIHYWEAQPGAEQGRALCAQLQDWRRFLAQIPTGENSLQQSWPELWASFKAYHLDQRQRMEQEIANLQKRSKSIPRFAAIYEGRIESAGRWCQRQNALLLWVDQTAKRGPAPRGEHNVDRGDGEGVAAAGRRRMTTSATKTPQRHRRGVLGSPGVSKHKRQLRNRSSNITPDKLPTTATAENSTQQPNKVLKTRSGRESRKPVRWMIDTQ